jgi:hypothetical protein
VIWLAEWTSHEKDYYAVLGVSPHADRKTISNAYRSKIKAIHPDSYRSVPDPSAGLHIAALVEAWRVLGDDDKRSDYDLRRTAGRTARPSPPPEPPKQSPRPPVLGVSPAFVDFGTVSRGEIVSSRIRLENSGGSATVVERSGTLPSWVSVSTPEPPRKGGSLRFPVELSVRVDAGRLSLHVRHRAEFTLRLANAADGLRSAEATVSISVAVGTEEVPRPAVSPGNWLVERCECLGAPRSILLHLFVGNGGGGPLVGTIESSSWIRVSSRSFGPIQNDAAPLHVVVEVDCAEWKEAGWHNGRLAVVTPQGDVRESVVIGRQTMGGGRLGRAEALWLQWFPLYLLLVAGIPWLAVAGAIPYQAVWIAAAAALLQCTALSPLREMEMVARGPRVLADGWSLGAPLGGGRFWSAITCWAALGGLLGIGVGGDAAPFLPAGLGGVLGCAGATVAALSVASRSGPLSRTNWGTGVAMLLLEGAGWLAIALGWSILCGLISQAMFGGLVHWAPLWGACVGWSVGTVLAIARNGAVPQSVRRWAEAIACAGAPVMVATLGFAAALTLAIDLMSPIGGASPAAIAVWHGRSSALMALPASSFSSAVVAAASCVGLLGGYCLCLVTLLPAISLPRPVDASIRKIGPITRWCGELLLEMAMGHAGLNSPGHDVEVRHSPTSVTGIAMQLHWTSTLIAVGVLLLGLYSAGHLLLALCAGLGIALG